MTTLYLDPVGGLSGDMWLALLFDLGLEPDRLIDYWRSLPIESWRLSVDNVLDRCPVGKQVRFEIDRAIEYRYLPEIEKVIRAASWPDAIQQQILTVFDRLADAEAEAHGVDRSEVHFHEIGAVDTILDISGVVIGLHLLGVDSIYSGPILLGKGTIQTSHGLLALPSPATASLLRGTWVRGSDRHGEATTPTGAALAKSLVSQFGPMPTAIVDKIGYGYGQSNRPANFVRGYLLHLAQGEATDNSMQLETIDVLTTNIDHASPDELGFAIDQLFQLGALDVAVKPIMMKKNRLAHQLELIVQHGDGSRFASHLMHALGTLGIRLTPTQRWVCPRKEELADSSFGPIRIKRTAHQIEPEHDEIARLSRTHQRPYREIRAQLNAELNPNKRVRNGACKNP